VGRAANVRKREAFSDFATSSDEGYAVASKPASRSAASALHAECRSSPGLLADRSFADDAAFAADQ
jgi:hypothetical protein